MFDLCDLEKLQHVCRFSENEHHFTADTHESCMIWTLALQVGIRTPLTHTHAKLPVCINYVMMSAFYGEA